jgi:Sigma-70 region 2
VTEEEQLAAEFEAHRPYLHAIAFRTLGSHADADDAVQEAWLRLARTGREGIEDLRGWLTTVTGRICLDALRRRGVRGEQPLELSIGMLPTEASGDARIDPEEEVLLADSVGLLAVLAPEVEFRADGRGGTLVVRGAGEVAARARTGARPHPGALTHPVLVDGAPGVLVTMDGRPVTIMAFTVADGVITAIRLLGDPDRLAQAVPSWVA